MNIDTNKIICGNSIDEMKKLSNESVDLIIADPPYNVGKNYGNNSDAQEREEYLKFSREWICEATRILKKNGTIYIFMGMKYISYIFQILEEENNMLFSSWITWHYTQGVGKKKSFSPRHDDILMFTKSSKYQFNLDEIRVPQKYYRKVNNMRGANPGNVWQFSHIHYSQKNRKPHPTQKPEGIIERMIKASSSEGDIVLDPFSGSGTTPFVSKILNRKYIGIELNELYVQNTIERLKQEFESFDSVDEAIKRIPNDLNDREYRHEYMKNHVKWFLSNHLNIKKEIEKEYEQKYKEKMQINSEEEIIFIDNNSL